jgi:serine/threonine protein kinase
MSNNSLDKHLFGEIRNALSWKSRLNIIVGTARGLAYLHEDSNVRIIHRDIKCANILLDDGFYPKIADFGLARLFPEGETHVSTKVGGTIGYTAPEYALHGQLSEKADVYSYGIVVLEIVSGRRCVDARREDPMRLLLEWAWNEFEHEHVLNIVDPTLEGQYPREQALRLITIALLCTQGSSALRPAMSEVASMLTNNLQIPLHPTQPAFIASASAPSQRSRGSISTSSLV